MANALRHAEPSPRACLRARSVGAVFSGVAIVFFSLQSYERSHVWQRLEFFMAEAARNYPEGVVAKTREASRAALEGNAHAAVAALRAARARGYNRLDNVNRDPAYRRIAAEPVFRELIAQWASEEIARLEKNLQPSQQALRVLAQYYLVQDDLAAAERSIRRAIERGGPLDEKVRVDLEQIERQKRIRGLSSGGSIPRR